MNQFRVERNQYGNMRIFCMDVPYGRLQMLERCVCFRQLNQQTGRYE